MIRSAFEFIEVIRMRGKSFLLAAEAEKVGIKDITVQSVAVRAAQSNADSSG
jgi:hypothetical protein